MKTKRLRRFNRSNLCALAVVAGVLWGAGCRVDSQPPAALAPDTTLYGRIGGDYGVHVISRFLWVQLRADTAIAHYFTGVDSASFTSAIAGQLCQLAGGSCAYAGPTMKAAHQGMGVSTADFNAFISDYLNALAAAGVAPADEQHVLQLLLQYQSDIVEKQ